MNTRPAQTSLLFAALTALSFCIGFVPIPFTALVCYPAALFSGLLALFYGLLALRQGESERWMAWAGILTGGFFILAVMCFTSLTALGLWWVINET